VNAAKWYGLRGTGCAAAWYKLPVCADAVKLRELLRSMAEMQVTVLVFGTGSGKFEI
jgi:hypothetical protein